MKPHESELRKKDLPALQGKTSKCLGVLKHPLIYVYLLLFQLALKMCFGHSKIFQGVPLYTPNYARCCAPSRLSKISTRQSKKLSTALAVVTSFLGKQNYPAKWKPDIKNYMSAKLHKHTH